MSKTITLTASLVDQSNNNPVSGAKTLIVNENAFIDLTFDLTTSPVQLTYSNMISVGYVLPKCVSGSDVLVSVDGGSTYLLRLPAGMAVPLPINTAALVETSTAQAVADDRGDLSGTYFDLTDRNGTVRVWMNTSGKREISSITVNTATGINGKYFDLTDDAGTVRVWIDVNNTGTPPTDPGRLIEVDVGASPTVADITNAIQAAIDADSKFSATDDNVDTITVTDASNGTRTDVTEPDSATYFTVSTTQQGAATSTAPADPGRLVEVSFAVNATAATIATAIATAFAADAELTVTAATDTATFVDKYLGTRTDITDSGSTGFTLATTQQGAAAPDIRVKSAGTSVFQYAAASK